MSLRPKLGKCGRTVELFRRWLPLCAALLACLCLVPRAQAEATLLLEEPYSYDGALAGTGHAAVYLSGICAKTPVELRPCAPGELGVVLSRYHRVAGYDWIAIPLIPYLYAVEKREDIPLYADKSLVAFLRDRYRRDHLESLIPDLPDGGTPDGDWYELLGESYLRTIYAYRIDTNPALDAALIRKLNGRDNHDHFDLITANCADFARQVIDFYHPRAVHRSIVADLGVTTPKQLARTIVAYDRHHPEFHPADFVIPQVPGTLPRSKPVHGVLECAVTAKKYMLPIFVLHPYIAGTIIAGYWGHWRFNPAQNAMVLDARDELDPPLTRADRRNETSRMQEIDPAEVSSHREKQAHWAAMLAAAQPALDASGMPVLQVRIEGEIRNIGVARANILDAPEGYEFAASLMAARLRDELKSAPARKAARGDIESDLTLLQRLSTPSSTHASADKDTTDPDHRREMTPERLPGASVLPALDRMP